MNRKDLIKKWLDHNLNAEEQHAFEQLDDYKQLTTMDKAFLDFKAPHFNSDSAYNSLKARLKPKSSQPQPWFKQVLKIAAVLAVGFSMYFYSTTIDSEYNTQIAEQTSIKLPDASMVDLNANSTLVFNKNQWSETRQVKLEGEAFFKVAKGQKFDVMTTDAVVSVLGTQFNVKQRGSYFEVTCFEGLVGVTYKNKTIKLKPQESIKLIDGKQFAIETEDTAQPSWLRGESSFDAIPLKYVIAEFENQYKLNISTEHVNTSRLYTGSFTHKNSDLALRSITIPLNLNYSKSGTTILLTTRE